MFIENFETAFLGFLIGFQNYISIVKGVVYLLTSQSIYVKTMH